MPIMGGSIRAINDSQAESRCRIVWDENPEAKISCHPYRGVHRVVRDDATNDKLTYPFGP